MPKAGSRRPSDRTSMVAHCLASSTGSRNASDTTFMPNFMRRVRPAKAAIVVIDSRNGWRLTIRSVCQIESTPPASHMSIQRQYAAAPENGNSAQPNPIPTPMRRLSARGHRRRGFDAPRDVAHEAFKTAVHLLWPHAGRHCPSDEIGDAVLAHEGCQLSHAVLDVADHPSLRDAGLARLARNAARGALVLVKAAIDLAAIALGGAHGRQRLQHRAPRIEHFFPRTLRQEVAVIASRTLCAGLRHRRDPERRTARLHVARPDHDVVEIVALAMETELLADEALAQHLDAFVRQRHTARDGQTEAAKLVRRIAMPTPTSMRPLLILSSTARSSASRRGWLNGSRQTSLDSRTRLVRAAIAPAIGTHEGR